MLHGVTVVVVVVVVVLLQMWANFHLSLSWSEHMAPFLFSQKGTDTNTEVPFSG